MTLEPRYLSALWRVENLPSGTDRGLLLKKIKQLPDIGLVIDRQVCPSRRSSQVSLIHKDRRNVQAPGLSSNRFSFLRQNRVTDKNREIIIVL